MTTAAKRQNSTSVTAAAILPRENSRRKNSSTANANPRRTPHTRHSNSVSAGMPLILKPFQNARRAHAVCVRKRQHATLTSNSPVSALMFSMYSPSPLMCNLPSAVCTVMSVSLKKIHARNAACRKTRAVFNVQRMCFCACRLCHCITDPLLCCIAYLYAAIFGKKTEQAANIYAKEQFSMLKAQSKNLLFFDDLVHHSRFVFFLHIHSRKRRGPSRCARRA